MSSILGINKGATAAGKRLIDGGACLLVDGRVEFAIAEERLSRTKHEGGFQKAAQAAIAWSGLGAAPFDLVVHSTCCEPLGEPLPSAPKARSVMECGHHLSHALTTYCQAPFDECLAFVADAGGNVLGGQGSSPWFARPREQVSWFKLSKWNSELLSRDFAEPYSMGFGELFRAMTFYCGWASAVRSGDAMTIAAYGSRHRINAPSVFQPGEDGEVRSVLVNDNPVDPVYGLQAWLQRFGLDLGPRAPGAPLSEAYFDLADYIQKSIAEAALDKAMRHSEQTGIGTWCLSGGLSYNTPLIKRFRETFGVDKVFVGLSPGDQGQCLGNAIFGHRQLHGEHPKFPSLSPFLGGRIEPSAEEIQQAMSNVGLRHRMSTYRVEAVVDRLLEGQIIAVARGRSEFGPRALGNRSLLASPFSAGMRRRLNRTKGRAAYMPIAPAVAWPAAKTLFNVEEPSEHMAQTFDVRSSWHEALTEVIHIDGTARLQCVRTETNQWFFDLLTAFGQRARAPCLGNTSLNAPNQPIIESLHDLVAYLASTHIRWCVIGDYFVEIEREEREAPMHTILAEFDEDVRGLAPNRQGDLIRRVQHTFGANMPLVPRTRFALEREYINWVRTGRKTTTVRYNKGAIDVPEKLRLEVVPTSDFEKIGDNDRLSVDTYDILRLSIKRFGDLNDVDGKRDGFADADELRTTLQRIYGPIDADELVTIYHIAPVVPARLRA